MLTIFGPIVVWSPVIVETLEYQGFICVLMGRDYYGVPVIKSLGAHARRRIMHHLRFFNTPTPLTDHDLSIYLSIYLFIYRYILRRSSSSSPADVEGCARSACIVQTQPGKHVLLMD